MSSDMGRHCSLLEIGRRFGGELPPLQVSFTLFPHTQLLFSRSAFSSTLKMEAARSYKASVNFRIKGVTSHKKENPNPDISFLDNTTLI